MLIPKWHRELDLFSAIKPLLIMEGNITDQYRYPTDGSIRQDEIIPLNKYLHTYFCDQGYDQVVFYSNLRGFRNTYDPGTLERFAALTDTEVKDGAIPAEFKGNGANTAPNVIQRAMCQQRAATVTVLDDGRERAQVRQVVLRKEPRADSDGVGTVTMGSQGVRVLERGEEWSKIQCYASSFHDSPILNWNALVTGWVETGLLKEIVPNQEMGFVVDKLTQRLYVFRDGKLYSTLLISTGLTNKKQPYNETRSGEFLLVSRVGGFYSDNMFCPRALRFNDGDLLHEVPYVERDDGRKIYSGTEPKLGTKASHGCIRVQRKKNPEGLNMEWIFNRYRENTKILIWEDWQGRQIPVPEDDAVFWCHPTKKEYYHCSDHCPMMNSKKPQQITYGELSAEGSKLKACPACGPVPKKSALLEINAAYAAGGDHDPVLTEARKDCPKKLKER